MKHISTISLLFLTCIVKVAFAGLLIGDASVESTEHYVQRSDDKALEVDFTFPGVHIETIFKDDNIFHLVQLEGEGFSGTLGAPELPIVTRLFSVPEKSNIILKKVEPIYRTYYGINPYPHQEYEYNSPMNSDSWAIEARYYQQGEIFPEKWVTLGQPAVLRDYRVVPVNISPVRVDASNNEIQVLTGLHLELQFDHTPSTNIKTHHFDKTVASFNNIYEKHIANYDWTNPNGVEVKGSLLIVYPDVPQVGDIISELVEWKTRLGYATTAESVPNNTTTSLVKSVIQHAYDNYDPPLEHAILIGDATGSICIPCYYWSSSSYTGASDHNYTQLDGMDLLADITIGRYSVANTTQLLTAVTKVIGYESAQQMIQTDWYKKGTLVDGGGGISAVQLNRNIRQWWLEDGYTQVDTMWDSMGGSIPIFIIDQFNDGITSFNYRGYIGMNGFTASNVYALYNAYMLPFAVILTCDTGNFGSAEPAISEAWLRAGTPTTPTGGIAGVGTSSPGTHTRFNNTVAAGLWWGIHEEGLTQFGPAVFRGKFELYLTYQLDPEEMTNFTYWNNLMGDPTTDLWTDIPLMLFVTHPDSIPVGSSSFTVVAEDTNGCSLEDRFVCLWKDDETYIGGRTDENGVFSAAIDVPTEGTLKVTVTYHNDHPYLADIPVYSSEIYPSFYSLIIDDDSVGVSQGNDDSQANPSEILELDIELRNFGNSTTATGVSASLSSEYEGLTIITAEQTYPDLSPGSTSFGDGKFAVELGACISQSYMIPFTLIIDSEQGSFASAFEIEVNSADLTVLAASAASGILDPGETDDLLITLSNNGQLGLNEVTATLSSNDTQITIIDNQAGFGDIEAGEEGDNSLDPFVVNADGWATFGRNVLFNMNLISENGFEQDLSFRLIIGEVGTTDPFGPDDYGYYCIDSEDLRYSGHPLYSWIVDIPSLGEQLDLPDYGNEQDVSTSVTLPFEFTFYGQTFQELTICSNGWLAFGDETYHSDFRNYPLPTPFGANSGMICPFWDDLVMDIGGVYKYFDPYNQRFIVEYSNVAHQSGGTERFQVILYDPAYYPTPTEDGEIVFQYQTVTVVEGPSTDNKYFTTGIMNHEHTDGLQYAYWNEYNPAASTLDSGKAVKFTTIEPLRASVSIEDGDDVEILQEYELGEAAPNPFNSTTTFSYALPTAGEVTIKVFNSLGRQIALLENGWRDAGRYFVEFDAGNLSSGIYFYNIKVNGFEQTRKILLIK